MVSDHGVLPGLWPVHGDGVLARQGDLVVLIHPAGGAFTDRLLDALAAAARAGQGGRAFTDLISAEFDSDADMPDRGAAGDDPAAVAFGAVAGGIAVTLYGAAWAEVTTVHGVQRITAGQPYGRLRCVLPSRVIKVRASVHAADDARGTDPYLRLAEGVVRAVALVYVPAEITGEKAAGPVSSQPAQAAPGEHAGEPDEAVPGAGRMEPEPSPRRDFISISFDERQEGAGIPPRDPLPLGAEPQAESDLPIATPSPPEVDGLYCKNGHFNDPEARYCAVCGIGMGQLTKVRHTGKRPPLGVLILADGSVCTLDADYVMGREPSLDTSVADGRARPLRLIGASGVVSRIHARVELDGWQVFISDLHSANGTQIRLPGESNAITLQPGVRTPLVAGAEIRLGGEYGLRYDSHRHR